MICSNCKSEWIPRVKHPKSCPSCKTRLDYGKWLVGKWKEQN